MGEPKERPGDESAAAGPTRMVSGAVPIGDRDTTPAPPSAEALAGGSALRSGSLAPTSVPLFDPITLEEGMTLDLRASSFSSGLSAVAYRTAAEVPAELDVRLAFVLLHVDGETSLEDIAQLVAIAPEEVQARFLELLAMGLVDLRAR